MYASDTRGRVGRSCVSHDGPCESHRAALRALPHGRGCTRGAEVLRYGSARRWLSSRRCTKGLSLAGLISDGTSTDQQRQEHDMTDEARDGGRKRQATSDSGAEGYSAGAQGNDGADENEQIRARAYERWLARGGQGGDEREDWLEAEREYRERAQGRQASDAH